MNLNWSTLKARLDTDHDYITWTDQEGSYYLALFTDPTVECVLDKASHVEEIADFEANYKTAVPSELSARKYAYVANGSTETDEYIPANAERIYLYELGGNAVYNNNVKVELRFGTDILFSTHGDSIQSVAIIITGDGSKVLAIRLVNDSQTSETIGGYYKGHKL